MDLIPTPLRRKIYELDTPDYMWVTQVARSLIDLMGLPLGLHVREGFVVADTVELGRRWDLDLPFDADQLVASDGRVSIASGLFSSSPGVMTCHDLWRADFCETLGPRLRDKLQTHAVEDCLLLMTSGSRQQRLLLTAPFPVRLSLTADELRRWRQVATHLSAAQRLRRRVHVSEEGVADASEMGLMLWRGLMMGGWYLTDTKNTSGHRIFVAAKAPSGRRRLSERERQVAAHIARGISNKLAAHQLGVASSTIATQLKSALRKLGLNSRVELVQLACQLVNDEDVDLSSGEEMIDEIDFQRLEQALTFCARELARLGDTGTNRAQAKKIKQLAETLRALTRILPDG